MRFYLLREAAANAPTAIDRVVMPCSVTFSAQCPTCQNDVSQEPRDRDEVRRLLREDQLYFYCGLCDHEWTPSNQELANVEYMLASR